MRICLKLRVISFCGQLNPVVTVPASLLSEEPMSGGTLGDEEEGVVSDPGTEILSENDEMVKVGKVNFVSVLLLCVEESIVLLYTFIV